MPNDTSRVVDLPANAPGLGDALARIVFSGVDHEDASAFPEALRLAIGQRAAAHLAKREIGVAKVAILDSVNDAGSVIEVVNDDMPFLLDSTLAELGERGFSLRLVA
ncbi:MAG: hypothetical protein INF18_04965, partial [Methylobacterium sp.]|nr:hypothetical protein [Methylobacterium sp.]